MKNERKKTRFLPRRLNRVLRHVIFCFVALFCYFIFVNILSFSIIFFVFASLVVILSSLRLLYTSNSYSFCFVSGFL